MNFKLKRQIGRITFSLAVCIFCLSPQLFSQDPATAAIGSISTKILLDDLGDKIATAVGQVGYETRFTAFAAAQSGHVLIDHFKNTYTDAMEKTFEQLNDTEKQAYEGLAANIERLEQALKTGGQEADKLLTELESATARLPFVEGYPRIKNYTPEILNNLSLKNQDKIFITINGVLLKQGNATINYKDTTLNPITHIDNKIVFALPKSSIIEKPETSITHKTLELEVEQDITEWWRFWTEIKKTIPYKLHLYLLPDQIGTITIVATANSTNRETRNVTSQIISVTSPGHTSDRAECFRFYPREPEQGWKIYPDPATMRFNQHHNDHGAFRGFKEITEHGFCAELFAKGKGWTKGRGNINGTVSYIEYRDVPVQNTNTLVSQIPIYWGQDYLLKFDDNVSNFNLEIETYWGEKKVATGRRQLGFANVEYDINSKTVMVIPVKVDEAFN